MEPVVEDLTLGREYPLSYSSVLLDDVSILPEPAQLAMLVAGVAALLGLSRRRQ